MKFLTNLSLWKKITILTAFGLALGVAVFGTLGLRAVNQANEAMLQDRLTTAHLVADYVDESLALAVGELEYSAHQIETGGVNGNFQSLVAGMESEYSRLSIYTRGIYLIDEKGQVVASEAGSPIRSFNLSSFADIVQAMQTDGYTISRMVSEPETKSPIVLLTSPLHLSEPPSPYALVVAIDLAQSHIGGFIRPLRLGQTGYVEIVDQNGVVISRTEPGPKLEPFEQSDHSGRFVALIDAGKPTRGVCHTCHEAQQVKKRDVLAFVPLSQAHWGVVVRQSETEALAPAYNLRRNLMFYGLGLAVVALLFVFVTTRDVGSRIRVLTGASRRIASGDLTSPVASLGEDEVGTLARTFDDMRSKLRTSYGNLEQRTKELSSLLSVSEILVSTLDLPGLLDAVVTKAVEVIPSADGGLLLLASDNGKVAVQCTVGLDNPTIVSAITEFNTGVPELAVSGQNPPQSETIQQAVRRIVELSWSGSKILSHTSAPLIRSNHTVGSLILVSFRSSQAFSDSDQRLLQAIAGDLSVAIERAELAQKADEARALQEADRLRSQFISSVSHELRTPLTVIKGYATSLLRPNVAWDRATQTEFLKSIDKKTDELRDLIDKILQSAKLEAGALKLEKEPLLLPRVAQRVVEENYRQADKHTFTFSFPKPFPVVEADTRCVEQIIRNLVENAVKYSPEGGEIAVQGEVGQEEVIISVKDSGLGIPPQFQDKIFERFFRVDSRLTRSISGSGLGLSICKGHVKAHGGRIWFESSPGQGSTFFFTLPLTNGEDPDLPGEELAPDDKENANSVSR